MKISRKIFFDRFKQEFDSSLDQKQVDGIEFLLSSFESEPKWRDLRHIAYALATVYHETAGSFQPVEEGYYLKGRAKAFQKTLRYYPYFGRGYVQLTWKKNYQKASSALGIDFIKNPDALLDPENSFQILTRGLFEGWFGSKLTTHINAQKTDYYNARRCINILDKAALIARYAKDFENILRASAAVPSSQIQAGQSDQTEEVTGTRDTQIGVVPTTDPASEQPPTDIHTDLPKEEIQSQTICKERPSFFTKVWASVVAGVGAITGLGVNIESLLSRATESITARQIAFLAFGAVLVALGIWLYDRSANRANRLNQDKLQVAANKELITTELKAG